MNMNNLPALTDEQRRDALEKAVASRKRQAEVKKQLADGTLKVSDVLSMDEEPIRRMRVASLLKSLTGIGDSKAQAFMFKHQISKNRRVGGLGRRQREALVEAFG